MALPNRLWLPDGGTELPTFIPGPRIATEPLLPAGQRWRRRAVLAGTDGQPERTVLVEWFALSELESAALAPLRGLFHLNLLRLYQYGPADAKTAYVLSEAPLGLDLQTIAKTASAKLPSWWAISVVCDAVRGLLSLHSDLRERGHRRGLGTIDASCIFVGSTGRVQVLPFAPFPRPLLVDDPVAPEVRQSRRLCTPAADVYSLATVLATLPLETALPTDLSHFLTRCRSPHAEKRPTLRLLFSQLQDCLGRLGAPLSRTESMGSELNRLIPAARGRDLSDGDWGSGGPVTFGPLPKTLSPLAATAVSLSATWDAAPPVEISPKEARFSGWLFVFVVFGVTAAGIGLGALVDTDTVQVRPKPPTTTAQLATVPAPELPTSVPLQEGTRGQLGPLRVQILRTALSSDGLQLVLLLTNPTLETHLFDPLSLRVSETTGSQSFSPEPVAKLELRPSQLQAIELRFSLPGSAARLRLWQQR